VQENKRQAARVEAILAKQRQAPHHLATIDRFLKRLDLLDGVMQSINERIQTLERDTNTRTITTADIAVMQNRWSVESHREPMYIHDLSLVWDEKSLGQARL